MKILDLQHMQSNEKSTDERRPRLWKEKQTGRDRRDLSRRCLRTRRTQAGMAGGSCDVYDGGSGAYDAWKSSICKVSSEGKVIEESDFLCI